MKEYKSYFRKAVKKYFPKDGDVLNSSVEKEFALLEDDIRFAETSKNPMDKRMGVAGYFLSLIKVLDARGQSFEVIRKICLEVATDYVQPKNKFQAWLKKLPVRIISTPIAQILLRSFNRKVGTLGHPDGFVANVITDKNETFGLGFGVDIIECGICKLYNRHNYKRFASILCEVDHLTTGLAGLQMIRSGTIANGAAKCDFRYRKV
jgi:hypothetical protein